MLSCRIYAYMVARVKGISELKLFSFHVMQGGSGQGAWGRESSAQDSDATTLQPHLLSFLLLCLFESANDQQNQRKFISAYAVVARVQRIAAITVVEEAPASPIVPNGGRLQQSVGRRRRRWTAAAAGGPLRDRHWQCQWFAAAAVTGQAQPGPLACRDRPGVLNWSLASSCSCPRGCWTYEMKLIQVYADSMLCMQILCQIYAIYAVYSQIIGQICKYMHYICIIKTRSWYAETWICKLNVKYAKYEKI